MSLQFSNERKLCRLRWHGHVEQTGHADYVKACAKLVVWVGGGEDSS